MLAAPVLPGWLMTPPKTPVGEVSTSQHSGAEVLVAAK